MRVLAVGGRQKRNAIGQPEWKFFQCGVITEIDLDTGAMRVMREYVSPSSAVPEDSPSIVFKAGTQVGDRLHVCTQTELLTFRLPDVEPVGYVSLPCFNDVHHVRPRHDGTFLVANTGLDNVLHLDAHGAILREWPVLPPHQQKQFDPAVDYRKWPTTKPHLSHPNYVFELDGRIWATRFEQRDAVCVEDTTQCIPIKLERPHDGIEFEGELYFTTVDGHLVMVDVATRSMSRAYDLARLTRAHLPLGWCRGIHVLSRTDVLVAFSQLRPIRVVDNLRWMVHKLLGKETRSLPTRIARFDLARGRCTAEWNVETVGMNAIFSIHPCVESLPPGRDAAARAAYP
jgi:hypothetical protein